MASQGPTYRIDPIEPGQIAARLDALLTRLEPFLEAAELAALRSLVDEGEFATAYGRLDAITDDGAITVDTAILVELVLLGQAVRPA